MVVNKLLTEGTDLHPRKDSLSCWIEAYTGYSGSVHGLLMTFKAGHAAGMAYPHFHRLLRDREH